jgi:type I restriction enzyme S subunit
MKPGWRSESFDAVIADESGGNTKTLQSNFLSVGQYPVVDQGKELIAGYVNDKSSLCGAQLPVIVFGDHTRCFKYIDFPFCMGADGIKVLRPRIDADVKYLYYYFRQLHLTEAGYDRHFKYLKRTDVVLPPLTEQRRIAELLDRAEALRAKRRTAIAQLDTLTHAIFLEMFGDPKGNERGWTLLKVGEAGRVQLGRQRAPQYQSGKHTRPYVRVANVYEDRLDLSDVLSMDFDREDSAAYRLEHGDILLNEGQSTELVGRAAMWRNEIPDCCFQNTLLRFQPDRETTLPEFALALFMHYFRSGEFAKISSKTSNVAHLGAGRFSAMPFPLPPIELQREFSRRVAAVERLKTAHRVSLAELDALFASLQHRAFRGEL